MNMVFDIVQIVPATDWYFAHDDAVWCVAACALTRDGTVIGMVGAGDDGNLVPVPRKKKGRYLQRRQLTDKEIDAADGKR